MFVCGAAPSSLNLRRCCPPARNATALRVPVPRGHTVQMAAVEHGQELDDNFSGVVGTDGLMTVAGFGSLLSETSARSTFPNLTNFRPARVGGFRRVFAHTCSIFFERKIARPETGEISSLSCEPWAEGDLVVSLFEIAATPQAVASFIEREHEFRFTGVHPTTLDGQPTGRPAVLCSRFSDEEYFARRCPPQEFERRYGVHGITCIWRDDILPCRVYLRHCVLAAHRFCPEAYHSFMDQTYLADRRTTVRQHLEQHPEIMHELPPPDLAARYNG